MGRASSMTPSAGTGLGEWLRGCMRGAPSGTPSKKARSFGLQTLYDRSCYLVKMPQSRKPRADGERTRKATVREAVSPANLDGPERLSIGNLADALDMS